MQYIIDPSVVVEEGVTVEPFAVVKGNSVLKKGCTVGSFCYICNSVIGQDTQVRASRLTDCKVGDNCVVGPYAHLRDGAVVGNDCRVGNFVEVKRSRLADRVKAAHLAYIGDAEVGSDTNVGCGVIFVNYDGKTKHRTKVGNNCFIGCNSNLVAPLHIGNNCFVACGTTVDKDAPDGAFLIGRSYVVVKEGRAHKYLSGD